LRRLEFNSCRLSLLPRGFQSIFEYPQTEEPNSGCCDSDNVQASGNPYLTFIKACFALCLLIDGILLNIRGLRDGPATLMAIGWLWLSVEAFSFSIFSCHFERSKV
jgi:hypothetical protein